MTAILTVTMNPTIDVSAATETVAPVRKLRCSDVRRDPGGGGINVARVVKRLGGAVSALYPTGGPTGRLLNRLVEAEQIAGLTVEVAADTRESFTVLETASGEQYRFVLPGPELAEAEWQACLAQLVAPGAAPPAFLVASGSLPPGVPDDFYARLAEAADAAGSRVILDTSGPALAEALDYGVYLVKPNLRELADLTGRRLDGEADWSAAAAEIVRCGRASVVALTLAERGALLVTRDRWLRAAAPAVDVASAVGAGDSFLAGLVWRLAEGGDLEDAFRYGVAAGSAALLTPGTDLAQAADIARLYAAVRVEALTPADGP